MNYQLKTLIELKEICKKKNLNGYSKLNKEELIQFIQNDNKKRNSKISKIKNKFQKGGEKLILTDKNIKKAVKLWFENKDRFEKKYGSISNWNVLGVTDMSHLFDSNNELYQSVKDFDNKISNFNEDLSRWNVINVTNMDSMFCDAPAFSQPLGQWKCGNATTDNMFSNSGMSTDNKPRCCSLFGLIDNREN